MLADSIQVAKRKSRQNGVSLLELLIGLAIISVMCAVALPSFMRAYRMYQLNDAAYQVAGVLKFTHYEAIRTSVPTLAPLNAQVLLRPAGTYIFTDSNGSGDFQPTERQTLFSGAVTLVPSTTPPNTAGLAGLVGVAAFTNISPTNGFISFDRRGAVVPPAVSVLYIGNTALPNLGDRAVVVLPTGSIQIWSTDVTGNWVRAD